MTIKLAAIVKSQPRTGPRYRTIADLIAEAVADGRLAPGEKLPPMRALAYELGVTVGTVARAYALASSHGLVGGEIGRGTYVRGRPLRNLREGVGSVSFLASAENVSIHMKSALAAPVGQTDIIGAALRRILDGPDSSLFNIYLAPGGSPAQRAAAARWIGYGDFAPKADDIILCSGTQQAILTALLSATEPGDLILTEALTYHAMIAQAALMGRRVAPVDMDEEGLAPQALEAAIREEKPRAIFTIPTLQNPTTAIMSAARRAEIARIARAHEIAIIEDDIYGTLVDDRPPPIAQFHPEGTYYATSLAKSIGCGLRIGFLMPPTAKHERARAIQHAFGQTVPPLMAELAIALIENGEGAKLVTRQKEEMRARHRIAREKLSGHDFRQHPSALHIWLRLPDKWRAHALAEAARLRGVAIAPGEDFMVGRPERASRHIRIALGQPQNRADLEQGLDVIASLLREAPVAVASPA